MPSHAANMGMLEPRHLDSYKLNDPGGVDSLIQHVIQTEGKTFFPYRRVIKRQRRVLWKPGWSVAQPRVDGDKYTRPNRADVVPDFICSGGK